MTKKLMRTAYSNILLTIFVLFSFSLSVLAQSHHIESHKCATLLSYKNNQVENFKPTLALALERQILSLAKKQKISVRAQINELAWGHSHFAILVSEVQLFIERLNDDRPLRGHTYVGGKDYEAYIKARDILVREAREQIEKKRVGLKWYSYFAIRANAMLSYRFHGFRIKNLSGEVIEIDDIFDHPWGVSKNLKHLYTQNEFIKFCRVNDCFFDFNFVEYFENPKNMTYLPLLLVSRTPIEVLNSITTTRFWVMGAVDRATSIDSEYYFVEPYGFLEHDTQHFLAYGLAHPNDEIVLFMQKSARVFARYTRSAKFKKLNHNERSHQHFAYFRLWHEATSTMVESRNQLRKIIQPTKGKSHLSVRVEALVEEMYGEIDEDIKEQLFNSLRGRKPSIEKFDSDLSRAMHFIAEMMLLSEQ